MDIEVGHEGLFNLFLDLALEKSNEYSEECPGLIVGSEIKPNLHNSYTDIN